MLAVLRRLEREFFIDNRLVRIHFIIVMIRWIGLAPWEFEFTFPGSLTSTFPGAWNAPGCAETQYKLIFCMISPSIWGHF